VMRAQFGPCPGRTCVSPWHADARSGIGEDGGMTLDHGDPGDAPSIPQPTGPVVNYARPAAAEEARTVAAATNIATLASLSADGSPWASFVTYGLLEGQPVLCVSRMAEHGRNLA